MNSATTTNEILCCPTALLPIGLSIGALLLAVVHLSFFGSGRGADDGAAALLWWVLMAAQVPAIAVFAIKWFGRARRPACTVLAIHGAGIVLCVGVAALASAYFLQ